MVADFLERSKKFITQEQTSIMSAATVIGALTLVSAVLGVVRQRFLFTIFYGEALRLQADAFQVAFRIPDFLFQLLVAGVLSATFIPVYTRVFHSDRTKAQHLVNRLITLLGFAYIVFAIIVGIFAPQILRIMTGSKFTLPQVILAAQMTRVMLFSTFFLLLSNFLSGILQSNKQFILPALSPVMYNLGIIAGIVFFTPTLGIYGPALGVVLGSVIHFLIQYPVAKKFGFSYKPDISLKDPNVKEVSTLMIPRGATLTTNYVEDFVGLYVVTSIGNTLVLIYNSAYQLAAAPIRLFGVSIAQAALPFLSLKAKEDDMKGFTLLVIQTLHQIAFFMFPIGALLLVLRIPIVRLVYGARQLPWADTVLMGRLVAIYSLSIASLAMTHVVLRAYYALKETKIPFICATISMTINIAIMVLGTFVFGFGILTVAMGPSVAAVVELLLLLVLLFRKVHYFLPTQFFIPQIKMVIATALMAFSLYVPLKLLDKVVFDTTHVVGLLLLTTSVSIFGMAGYIFFSYLLKVDQLQILVSMHGKLRNWRQRLGATQEVLNMTEEGMAKE